ncbi:MAG: zinc-ribbon domain-containing protein [Alphaproteobacteria bacterium]|nr:zinc-ribbon domain-containing protein [Alphaproteobacteria bacterium]MCB9698931.1 zinc-ribbon domain-containing protein [Alphaproteobacteria bacterium]
MKVVCDNCRAVYKVPDDKLTKAVNKATCRNCGHRMLIPRPKPNADPEERTLVTAVPPTPVGAPPRMASHRDDEHESTLPGRAPSGPVVSDDVHMETPMMAPRSGDTLQAHDPYATPYGQPEYEPDVVTHIRSSVPPSEQVTHKERPPARPPQGGPASLPPPRRSQTPAPASYHAPPSNPPVRRTPAPPPQRRTPAPPPQRQTPGSAYPRTATPMPPPVAAYAPMAHDPAGDLNWALLGTSMALMGSVLLSVLSIWNHALVMWFGLAMTFGGGVLSFLVLITGGRGRKPAQTLLSVVLGFMVAVVMASLLVGTKWGVERAVEAINFSDQGALAGMAVPTGGTNTLASVSNTPTPDTQPVVEPPPVEPEPAVPEPSRPRPQPTRPKPQPSRPQPTPQPIAPAPMPVAPAPMAPPPAPAPAQMETVPIEAVHVMVSNNIEVKKCFVPLFKAGALPPRVDAKFTISPGGQATGVTLLQQQYRGTELEACLGRAIASIRFPAASKGTAITYPFVMQ